MFQKLFLHTALSTNGSTFVNTYNAATPLLEPQKHFHVKFGMPCSLGLFYFPIENESVWFGCFPLCHHRTGRWREGARIPPKCQVASVLNHGSLLPIPSLSFIGNGLCFLLAMVPSDRKLQGHQRAQNERHSAGGAARKGGTRVEWRSFADWPHARAVAANCFCNFRPI